MQRNTAKVTLCLWPGVLTTADVVDRIALESVSGNSSASGNAGDVQQNVAAPAPSPPKGFDERPPVTSPLLEGGAGVPRRPRVAASAAFAPAGRWSATDGDASREVAFHLVVGPREPRDRIAMEQARPIAPADRVEMTAKGL